MCASRFSLLFTKLLGLRKLAHTNAECIDAFVKEMNNYASRFGMRNTKFVNPHGRNETGHYSCAKDIARMTMCATAYKKLMEFWGETTYSVAVGGDHARTITGASTYKGEGMTSVGNYYHIFGGKSGMVKVSNVRHENLCLVVKSKVDDAWLVGCILNNTNNPEASTTGNRGVPFKEMLDWLEDYRQNPSTAAQPVQATYCSAWVMPPYVPTAYADVDLEMVGKSSTTQTYPASTTKLMTAMVVLDHLNLNETVTVKSEDIMPGSGDIYYAGDSLSVGDALLALLLPSSNTLAVTLARVAGEKILNAK